MYENRWRKGALEKAWINLQSLCYRPDPPQHAGIRVLPSTARKGTRGCFPTSAQTNAPLSPVLLGAPVFPSMGELEGENWVLSRTVRG